MHSDPDGKKPGAEPDTLKIEGSWEDAVARALRAPIPPGGVPEKPSRGRVPKRQGGKK